MADTQTLTGNAAGENPFYQLAANSQSEQQPAERNPFYDLAENAPSTQPSADRNPFYEMAGQGEPAPQPTDGFFQSVYQGAKSAATNWAANQALEVPREKQILSDAFHGQWSDAQKQARDLFLGAAVPEMSTSSFEANPNPAYPSSGGLWQKTKAVANYPLLGTFHRKGSGPIESEAEDWLTGQMNPLNLGLAVASMGTSLAEGALVKLGLAAETASGVVHAAKTAANLAFLTTQGFGIGKAIPGIERDYDDWKNAQSPDEKDEALDKLKRDSTDLVLSSLATGLAAKGVESDIRERMASGKTGKAFAHPDYADAMHDYQDKVQRGNGEADQFAQEGANDAPKAIQREGITNSIEAGENPFVLAEREAESAKDANPQRGKRLSEGYKAAQNLSPKEQALKQRINDIHADYLTRLQDAGFLPEDGVRDVPGSASPIQRVYHGTQAPEVTDIGQLSAEFSRNGLAGKGVYTTPNPAEAGQYAGPENAATGGKVLSGVLNPGAKILEGNAPLPEPLLKRVRAKFADDLTGSPKSYLDFVDSLQRGLADVSEFQREVARAGYDAVKYTATYPSGPRSAIMIFGEDVSGKPLSDILRPGIPTAAPVQARGYIHHAYNFEDVDTATGEPIEGEGGKNFIRRRVFPTYYDAERAGFEPKTKDAVALTADYIQKANALLARQKLADRLSSGVANDGSPLGVTGGIVAGNMVIPDAASDARVPADRLRTLQSNGQLADLLQKGRVYQNEDGSYSYRLPDYRDSGLKTNKWIGNDEQGNPMFARVPLLTHPDITEHVRNALDASAPTGFFKTALKASSVAKSALLALSPFHWDTIFNRGLEVGAGKEIFSPRPVDYFNLTENQKAALRGGVVVANTRPFTSGYLEEGLGSGGNESPINKGINAALKKLGVSENLAGKLNLNQVLEHKLFGPQGYITRLKFQTFDALKPEIMRQYPNLSEEQAGRIAAQQVNNKFGGLNYTLLGRSMSSQSALRALTLAPDFLESTGRSLLDVVGPYGKPLLKRFIEFQAAHYLIARVVNYAVSGDLHPESGFSVMSRDGKKEYNLRTTLGDFLHFIRDPRDFAYNRLNPLLVRTPLEAFYGVNQRGRRLSDSQRETSILRQVTPISLQGPLSKVLPSVYGNQGVAEPSASDQFLKSFGVGSVNRLTPAESLALQRLSGKNEGGALEGDALVAHQNRFKLEDDLRTANQSGNPFDVLAAEQRIDDAAKAGVFTREQVRAARKDARLTRLQSSVKRLPLADALDVWDTAGIHERQSLTDVLFPKIISWRKRAARGEVSESERDLIQKRIAHMNSQVRRDKTTAQQNPFYQMAASQQ